MKLCREAVGNSKKWRQPKIEDDIKNEDNLKNGDNLKNQNRTGPELTQP